MAVKLDEIDITLLTALQADADRTNVELAKLTGLSPAATLHRVRALKESGVIRILRAQVDPALREASATLGASSLRTFLRITLPLSVEGVIAGLVLSFAHTVGEFGVVLMVGGNLPGITRTVSIAIYDQVQALQYREATLTAFVMVVFAFAVLAAVYGLRRRPWSATPLA